MPRRARSERQELDEGRMTLMEHLGELRNRIIICAVAIALAATVGFIIYPQLLHWLEGPLREATKNMKCSKELRGTDCDKLITTDYLQPFIVRLKLASYFGILIASPVVMWEIWRFVTPGLNDKEKKYALPFILSSIVLFLLGGFVAWF